jgi:hypothetical protein
MLASSSTAQTNKALAAGSIHLAVTGRPRSATAKIKTTVLRFDHLAFMALGLLGLLLYSLQGNTKQSKVVTALCCHIAS